MEGACAVVELILPQVLQQDCTIFLRNNLIKFAITKINKKLDVGMIIIVKNLYLVKDFSEELSTNSKRAQKIFQGVNLEKIVAI
jgi:hypothetical protein